jgi:CDP-diacylglycerol--serine O-phosphatidyltransferase
VKDYITLLGTVIGLIALLLSFNGTLEFISVGFFLVSITLGTDLIDGYIARKTGTVNEMGRELDSLSDSLTFGIVPSCLLFQAFKTNTSYDIILIIGCICFALGAILRLARFNITQETGYIGVPTPVSALMVIAFFYFNYFFYLSLGGGVLPFPLISHYAMPFILILLGWFNITTYINFGEKKKRIYVLILIFAPLSPIFGIIGLANINSIVNLVVSIVFLTSFIGLIIYVLIGFYLKYKSKKKKSSQSKKLE